CSITRKCRYWPHWKMTNWYIAPMWTKKLLQQNKQLKNICHNTS
ncbi:hypothetical protein, partial [Methylomonas fluvii]